MSHPSPAFGLASFLLVACGTTTVHVELTDAPPDTDSIEHVFVSLSRVEAHVAGGDGENGGDKNDKSDDPADDGDDQGDSGGGWRTVTAKAGTFDLLALRNDVRATLGDLELPDGKITQIRLFIAPEARNEVVLVGGQHCALELSGVPPTGVKINHPFKAIDVTTSDEIRVVIDFDAKESLDANGACSFALRPVIKLKQVDKL
jgi:hypothetical protein